MSASSVYAVLARRVRRLHAEGFRATMQRCTIKGRRYIARAMIGRKRFDRGPFPSLEMLYDSASSTHVQARELIDQYDILKETGCTAEMLMEEYAHIRLRLQRAYEEFKWRTQYPESYAIEDETSFLLYSLVRCLRPRAVLETGVADGRSSCIILQAMAKNGVGVLYSVDVSSEVGSLVSDEMGDRWHLKLLGRDVRRDLQAIVNDMPEIDIFIHDSDHSYLWQLFEYRVALGKIQSKMGLICSDDVDKSYLYTCPARQGGGGGSLTAG
jgi:predicted O-methyltransferase YrrM